jgi:hypothetical protein
MDELKPVTKCPRCGHTGIERTAFAQAKADDLLTCPNCKSQFTKDHFVAELLNESTKRLRDALRKIKGFKPK